MLRVVLVEDEEMIREGLINSIDWRSSGFEVAGDAEDGEEGLKLVRALRPDVVITDIRMPFMNGLELTEIIKQEFPQIAVIIISGHDEFEYAKRALRSGVKDYVLKPIEVEPFISILQAIKMDFDLDKIQQMKYERLEEKVEESLTIRREKKLNQVLFGNINTDYHPVELNGFINNQYGVILVQIDDYAILTDPMNKEMKSTVDHAFLRITQSIVSKFTGGIVVENNKAELIICISAPYVNRLSFEMKSIAEQIRNLINKLAVFTVSISFGSICDSLQQLAQSYLKAREALKLKFVIGKNSIMGSMELMNVSAASVEFVNFSEAALIASIRLADKELIKQNLQYLFEEIQKSEKNSYLYMQMTMGSIFTQVLNVVKDIRGTLEEVFRDHLETYRKITEHQTMEGMIQELTQACLQIADYILIKRFGRSFQIIEKAKEFIKANYLKEDLSLEAVASHINMGSSYFSFIFKQESKMTFIDYLTTLRIEKAKELLQISGYKTYEICYKVGYNNPTYFSTIFKKYVSVSPTEYKNTFLRTKNEKT